MERAAANAAESVNMAAEAQKDCQAARDKCAVITIELGQAKAAGDADLAQHLQSKLRMWQTQQAEAQDRGQRLQGVVASHEQVSVSASKCIQMTLPASK